jgi:hypothetical protein
VTASEKPCEACETTRAASLSISEYVTRTELAHERHHALLAAEREKGEQLGKAVLESACAVRDLRAEVERLRGENLETWRLFKPIRTAAYDLEVAIAEMNRKRKEAGK